MSGLQLTVFIGCLLLVIAGVGVSVGYYVGLEQAFTAALTAALVYVTGAYALFTFQIVRASDKQARIMSEQQVNSAAPVITLEVRRQKPTPNELEVDLGWMNIGKGPALNLRCWIEDPEHPELRVQHRAICRTAVEVALRDTMCEVTIHTGITNYKLGLGYIRAQYESIFNRTYESSLFFPENTAPELKYGEATERVIL